MPAENDKESSNPSQSQTNGSGTPTASSSAARPGPSRRPTAAPSSARPSPAPQRGKPAVTARPKFAGRRSQAARAELEKEEARKKAAELEAAAAQARSDAKEAKRFGYSSRGGDRGGRGAGRGGRGRGGYMGDQQRRKEQEIASGPFGSGQVTQDSRYGSGRSGWSSGGGGGSGGGSGAFGGGYSGGSRSTGGVKMEHGTGGMSMSGNGVKVEDGGYISSDDDEGQANTTRQNVDDLQTGVVDLTIGDAENGEDPLAPVRLRRVPHKDRTVGLSADVDITAIDSGDDETGADRAKTTKRRRSKPAGKDVEIIGTNERPKRPTAYSSSSETEGEPQVKAEPTDEGAEMADVPDATDHPLDPPSSPESKRRAKGKIRAAFEDSNATNGDLDHPPLPPAPKFQTDAEVLEWKRKHSDLRLICDELGKQVPKDVPTTDADGDSAMPPADDPVLESAKKAEEHRSENVYLFQFPPVLPNLQLATVKPDPDAAEETDLPPPTEQPTAGSSTQANPAEDSQPLSTAGPHLPSGLVGKLKIHKSGKATLDWGGTSLSLGMGTEMSFLQSVLIAQYPDKKPDEEISVQEGAYGMGMGQVRGKFVLTPNWDEIL